MTSRMLVGLIGTNIQKSLAPALHEDAFAAAGVSGHYHLMDVATLQGRRLEDLLAAARTAGFAGVTILMIEQNARQALAISDYGLVLEQGQTRIEDTAANILADPRIAQLFLGGGLAPAEEARP